MSSKNPKRALFEQFALVAKTIAHPDRLEILEHLGQGERGVDALAKRLNLPLANVSQHLQHLRRAGLVVSRREGKFILYRVEEPNVFLLLTSLRRTAEKNVAEVDRIVREYFHERDSLEAISRDELLKRSSSGDTVVLDVRPADEFFEGHIAGAVNIPIGELEDRLDELDANQEIVAYCRGAYCVMSFEAVSSLRARGFKVRRLEDGFPEWKAAGMPIS